SLLSLPWNEIASQLGKGDRGMGIPAFRRTVEVPEYHDGFQKILPRNIALFRGGTVAKFVQVDGAPSENIVIATPENVIFGTADPPANRFPIIAVLVKKYGCVS